MTILLFLACVPGKLDLDGLGDTSGDSGAADTAAGDTDAGDSGAETGEPDDTDDTDDSGEDTSPPDTGCDAVYYRDADGDGFGDVDDTTTACELPDGYADNGADCDDGDADVHPGATDGAGNGDEDCDGERDEDATEPVEFSVSVTWDATGATVAITGDAPSWDLGMAETGVGTAGWYGETCVVGEEPGGYEDYGYDVCHRLGASGGSLVSTTSLGVVASGYTLFNEHIAGRDDITYALFDTSSADCWVWGHDVGYYADFGCTEV